MAIHQVLLLEPVEGLGAEGETVSVKAGYARNYLLPRRLALPINQANRKYVESLQKARDERQRQEIDKARDLASKIEAASIAIAVKTGEGGKLFGSVSQRDLLERLREEGVELDKKQLLLPAPVKTLGSHSARVKLHPEIETELHFEVVSENPIQGGASEEAATAASEES